MKKRIRIVLLTLTLAVCLCLPAMFTNGGTTTAHAASIKQLEVSDSFDSSAFDDQAWSISGGAELETEYSALRLMSVGSWGNYCVFQKQPILESWDQFTIEMDMAWFGASTWSGMFFGAGSATQLFYASRSSYALMFNHGSAGKPETGRGIRLSARDTGSNSGFLMSPDNSTYYQSDLTTKGNLLANGSVVRMQLAFTAKQTQTSGAPKAYSMMMRWGTDPNSLNNTHAFDTITPTGFMGFTTEFSSNGINDLEIRSLKINADGEKVVDYTNADLATGSISYPSAPSISSDWRTVGIESDKAYCGRFGFVGYQEDGALVYQTPLRRNPYSTANFESDFDLRLLNAADSTYVGMGFGLDSVSASVDSNAFIGVRKDSNDKFWLGRLKGGVLQGNETEVSGASTGFAIRFVVHFDGSVAVYLSNAKVPKAIYKDVDFEGYAAIGRVSTQGGGSGKPNVDNVNMYIYESLFSSVADMGIAFTGVRETELFGSIVQEHYVNSRKWVMYGGAKLPMQASRKYLQFSNVRGDVAFLPKAQFGDSIVRFDFMPTSLDATKSKLAPFGFSFGRAYMDESYITAPGVYFRPVNDKNPTAGTQVYGRNLKTSSGDEGTASNVNVFADTETWYTCLMILSNRQVQVFLKKTADPDIAFGAPQIVFENANNYGFVALTIDGKDGATANYNVTNFSIVNMDPIVGEDN